MSFLQSLGFTGNPGSVPSTELFEIFPFPVTENDFVLKDVQNVYSRILTDVLERTSGIPEQNQPVLWDNCLASESSMGLVSLLADAMVKKADLFLVYDRATNVLRKANQAETTQITNDYKARAASDVGVYVSFNKYTRSDMLKIYSQFEYYTVSGLYKNSNLSKAIQIKTKNLRASVATIDSGLAVTQAKTIAESLRDGKDVLLDSEDIIETAKPDMSAVNSAMEFINQKRSFYLGLPASYITGLAPKGLGDSGEGESKAVERGLKNYFFSIIKPTVEALFRINVTFKSEDFHALTSSLDALRTFDLASDQFLSAESKLKLINKFFGLPEDTRGGSGA